MKIRCSSLPRVFDCPGSITMPDSNIDFSGAPARVGTAVHEVLADWVEHDVAVYDTIDCVVAAGGLDKDEVSFLAYSAWSWWQKAKGTLNILSVEAEMKMTIGDVLLTGHADIICEDINGNVVIVDWKTGYMDGCSHAQLLGYAALVAQSKKSDKYKTILVYPRLGEIDIKEFSAEAVEKFVFDLQSVLYSPSKKFAPGSCCTYCPHIHNCDQRQKYISSCAIAIAPDGALPDTPAKLAALKPQRDALKKAIDDYDAALKMSVEQSGQIVSGDKIYTIEDHVRESISIENIKNNIDIIGAIGYDMIRKNTSVSKSALIKILGREGKKTFESLKKSGVVEEKIFRKLTEKRAEK